jgi:hypothetical protein
MNYKVWLHINGVRRTFGPVATLEQAHWFGSEFPDGDDVWYVILERRPRNKWGVVFSSRDQG